MILNYGLLQKEQQPVNDGSLFEQRKELSKEVDQLKKALTQQVFRFSLVTKKKEKVFNFSKI